MKWKPLLQQSLPQKVPIICVFCLCWRCFTVCKSSAAESGYYMATGLYRCRQRYSCLRFGLGVQVMWVRSLLRTA